MTVSPIDAWRRPGCSSECLGRRHDPIQHEAYGFLLGELATRPTKPEIVRTGSLVVDLSRQQATVAGRDIHTTEREWQLLAYLAERAGQLCSHDECIRGAWGEWYLTKQIKVRARRYVTRGDHDHLRTVLGRLRSRLGQARHLIVTEHGQGLRLEMVEPVS